MTIKLYLLLAHCTAREKSSTTNNRNYLSMSQFVFDKRSCFLYFCSHWMRGDDQSMQISMYFIKFWSLSYFLYQQNIARIFQEANTVLNMNWSIKKKFFTGRAQSAPWLWIWNFSFALLGLQACHLFFCGHNTHDICQNVYISRLLTDYIWPESA